MTTITIPKKEYQNIVERQLIIEKELALLKENIFRSDEFFIRPEILRRWERISGALDKGNGHSFTSVRKMKEWLKNL